MPSDGDVLIEVKDLRKSFGDHEVLKGINTTIRKGEVVDVEFRFTFLIFSQHSYITSNAMRISQVAQW